jgi:hypothetical protein
MAKYNIEFFQLGIGVRVLCYVQISVLVTIVQLKWVVKSGFEL